MTSKWQPTATNNEREQLQSWQCRLHRNETACWEAAIYLMFRRRQRHSYPASSQAAGLAQSNLWGRNKQHCHCWRRHIVGDYCTDEGTKEWKVWKWWPEWKLPCKGMWPAGGKSISVSVGQLMWYYTYILVCTKYGCFMSHQWKALLNAQIT